MICAISWTPKGASKAEPAVGEPPSKDEIQDLLRAAMSGGGGSENGGAEAVQSLTVDDAIGKADKLDSISLALKELDMDHYDDEDEGGFFFGSDLYHQSNDQDPNITDKNDEDSEELDDMIIYPTDSVIVCVYCEGCDGSLKVVVVEDAGSSQMHMYSLHSTSISVPPLCSAWLDCPLKGGERGNFIAVGSMKPYIEIWDLDVIDEVKPCVVLGGKTKEKENGKKKSIKCEHGGHTKAVLGLAWNKEYRNILASASADKRVKIWDVVAGKCDITMEHHSDKVQAVAWNPHAPHVLLSGSFDHSVVLKDGRMPSHSGFKWLVTADVESLAWDPHSEHSFVASLEDGIVKSFDVRTAKSDSTANSSATFTLHAHEEAVTTVSYNPSAPNLLATGSLDETVKLWDLSNNQPSCVACRTPEAGAVFCVSFSEDNPFVLAIGGSNGEVKVWNTLSESAISRKYLSYNKRTT